MYLQIEDSKGQKLVCLESDTLKTTQQLLDELSGHRTSIYRNQLINIGFPLTDEVLGGFFLAALLKSKTGKFRVIIKPENEEPAVRISPTQRLYESFDQNFVTFPASLPRSPVIRFLDSNSRLLATLRTTAEIEREDLSDRLKTLRKEMIAAVDNGESSELVLSCIIARLIATAELEFEFVNSVEAGFDPRLDLTLIPEQPVFDSKNVINNFIKIY